MRLRAALTLWTKVEGQRDAAQDTSSGRTGSGGCPRSRTAGGAAWEDTSPSRVPIAAGAVTTQSVSLPPQSPGFMKSGPVRAPL